FHPKRPGGTERGRAVAAACGDRLPVGSGRAAFSCVAGVCVAIAWLNIGGIAQSAPPRVFPGKQWDRKRPAEVGLDASQLERFSRFVGGRGCVVRYGYLVYSWGDIGRRADIASAAKPFYTHFLFKALEDGRIESLDERVVRWEPRLAKINAALGFKDARISWRHLATQTSCY
ncbi:MAG: hypothetical protein D6725_05465, partial [Planctomycetota bacterium]